SKIAGQLNQLTKEIAKARQGLERERSGKEKTGPKGKTANRALSSVVGLRNTLRDWFGFYDGYDPLFSWWTQEPYKSVDQALEGYAGFLGDRLGAAPGGAGEDPELGPGRRRGAGASAAPGREQRAAGAESPREPLRRDQEIVGNPIGREALLSELSYEMI